MTLPALPTTVEALIKGRKIEKKRSINDQCDDVFVALWGDKAFRSLHQGRGRVETVNGHALFDGFEAAKMIKDKAHDMGFVELANSNSYDVYKSMNVIKRRYAISSPKAKAASAPAAKAA